MSQVMFATITSIAQSLGIPHVKESIATKLSQDVQRQIVQILSESVQYTNVTKSKHLRPMHINLVLESHMLEPLFGYRDSSDVQLVKAGTIDALDLFVYDDRSVLLDQFARFELSPYPLETSFEFEWLSVVGHQRQNQSEELETYTDMNENLPDFQTQQQKQRPDSDLITASSKHVFSYELQLLFQKSRDFLLSSDPKHREQMLSTLKKERCLETLLPYYIRFSEKILKDTPRDYSKLYISNSVIRALVQNEDLSIDIYLPQIMSFCLTLLLSDSVAPRQIPEMFLMKQLSSDILKILIERTLSNYPNVSPSVASQLISILLDKKKALSTKYGAVVGLIALGLNTISSYFLPILPTFIKDVRELANDTNYINNEIASRVYEISLEAFGLCLHHDTYKITSTGITPLLGRANPNYYAIIETFGGDIAQYYIDESYSLSI